ncbi:hypothetical protein F5Y12DRAFT_747914 [Xylaria sp. FL1777]|nr:hypothetical protein F5Y12DRAFT_747914 [Xylaria sp. FL1777]
MEREPAAQTSHFYRLPPELIDAILYSLKNLTTVRCTILNYRLLYNAFSGSASTIASRAMVNELDSSDVHPEAIAALQASKIASPTLSSIQEFYTAHF